jgi:hypothetical protein
MKTGENNKLAATILALSAVLAISVVVLINGCKPSSYPTEDNSLVSSNITSTVTTTTPPPTGAVLQSIALSESNGDGTVVENRSIYYTATGTYLDTSTGSTTQLDITTDVDWTSSDPATAEVKIYKSGSGMGIMGMKVGTVTITATKGTVSQSATLNVLKGAAY